MKWTYFLRQKLKIGLALAIVLGLVVLTNIVDRNYFTRLQASFTSVYKDRLIVEGYILQLSNQLHERHLRLLENELSAAGRDQQQSDTEIKNVLVEYEKTVFTEEERQVFETFRTQLSVLQELESEYAGSGQDSGLLHQIVSKHAELAGMLNALSRIQIDEGRNQINRSEKIVASSYFLSRIEIVVIIITGLLLQVLLMSTKSVASRFPQNSRLN